MSPHNKILYRSSVAAAKSLSPSDIGDVCLDALILFWLRTPGVRRYFSSEDVEFAHTFTTTSPKPEGWTLLGFEERIARV